MLCTHVQLMMRARGTEFTDDITACRTIVSCRRQRTRHAAHRFTTFHHSCCPSVNHRNHDIRSARTPRHDPPRACPWARDKCTSYCSLCPWSGCNANSTGSRILAIKLSVVQSATSAQHHQQRNRVHAGHAHYLPPLCNQIHIGVLVGHTILVKFLANCMPLVVKFVDVARSLVMDAEHGPKCLSLAQTFVRLVFH